MNCPHCGALLPDKSKFCSACGKQTVSGDAGLTATGDVTVRPHRKLKRWHKIVLGTVATIAMIAAVPFYMTTGVTGAVEKHVKAIRAGKLDDAYGMTAKGFKKITTREDFAGFVRRHPVLAENTEVTVSSREIKKGIGTLEGKATAKTGETRGIMFRLVKEDGTWRIISIHVDPTGLY